MYRKGYWESKVFFFDKELNLLRYNIAGKNAPKNFTLPKPKLMDKMFEIAEVLSKEIPFVRVVLYCENNKIYFGELTIYPQSGFDSNLLNTADKMFEEQISIQ